jgi:anthranilate 1,2-dioxygenase large subunit
MDGAGGNGGSAHGGWDYQWPDGDETRIPDWIYTSDEIYQRERSRIFLGPTWNYVALEAELPDAGNFTRSYVGDVPVVVTRDGDGAIHVLENRCAHRGVEFCRALRGTVAEFMCPYHQWTYDLSGRLIGVPFRRGYDGRGGMPDDFRLADHGVRALRVARRHGVVFATFSEATPELADYLGRETVEHFDTVFAGRELRILGYYRNSLHGNWKLYHENLKDPYHATLLHVFLVNFRLIVAGQKSAMIVDRSGRHGTLASARDAAAEIGEETARQMKALRPDMELNDPRLLDYVPEFDSPWTVTMQTIWPNLIVQRELNTLGIRHIVPHGPHAFHMYWTMFGYADDSEEMTRHRLRQGNLMGPSGYLGVDDNEAIRFEQQGVSRSVSETGLVAMESGVEGTSDCLISEAAIRAMYRSYREVMEL